MEIRTGSVDFTLPLRGSGPRTSSQTLVFPRSVISATAGLSGYSVGYSGDDHHIGNVEVRLDATWNSNTVTVNGTFGLRDWSGSWDDEYEGHIDFAVLAELESATAPPPRPDLIITGMELNQAVQFFRAASYLDGLHVLPDNAIWLVARKLTGIRVYVDWDSSAGLPSITNLTGSVVVRTANTTFTLSPINPGQTITPQRDNQINMAESNHTLNFAIPAAWCVGTIMLTVQVWDPSSPASKSAAFTRTVVFSSVNPLNLYLVGIDYNALSLPAPSQTQITNSLSTLIKAYPVGDVIQTGYTTIQFNGTVTGNIADGCGDGMEDLLDTLDDLRGDSTDIYLGSLPANIVSTPGNSIGGCAPTPGHVAATFVDRPGSVSHEVGHALGREHAPCSSGCNQPPADPDPDYPQYGAFASDSIGIFGFDPDTNTVFNPASSIDMMGYISGRPVTKWISPYTYNGLRGSAFGATSGPVPGAGPILILEVHIRTLFLGLTISRDRKVTRRPSFNYMAPRLSRRRRSQFTLEFLNKERKPLSCSPLHHDCAHGSCSCWPKVTRDQVPMPEGARWLLVWEGEKKIYEEEIPDPPVVKIESADSKKDGVLLKWYAHRSAKKNLWYMVHWYDNHANSWRGVGPRQQTTSLLIPRRLFVEKSELRVRVLATSGIATGVAEEYVSLSDFRSGRIQVTLAGIDTELKKPCPLPNLVKVNVFDQAGRELLSDRTAWYGNNGAELAQGRQVDLRPLKQGRHLVRVVLRGLGDRTLTRSWLIERTRDSLLLHDEVYDPKPRIVKEDHHHPHPPPDQSY